MSSTPNAPSGGMVRAGLPHHPFGILDGNIQSTCGWLVALLCLGMADFNQATADIWRDAASGRPR